MNYLWGGMIVIGVVYAILTGNLDAVTEQALVSAKEAISLCITMAGAMAFWVCIMRIAERAYVLVSIGAEVRQSAYADCNEYGRECVGTWLGGNSGRIISDEGTPQA